MKKLIFLVISLFVTSMALAHGPGWRGNNQEKRDNSWKGMDQHHRLMHDTKVIAAKTDTGVKIEITAETKEVQELIKKEFVNNQTDLKTYFKDVNIVVESLNNGLELTFSTDDSKTVEQLQHLGNGLVYRYLRDKVLGSMSERGSHFRHHRGSGSGGGCAGSGGARWDNGPISYRSWIDKEIVGASTDMSGSLM